MEYFITFKHDDNHGVNITSLVFDANLAKTEGYAVGSIAELVETIECAMGLKNVVILFMAKNELES